MGHKELIPIWKKVEKVGDAMTDHEQRQLAIDTYVNLMRIKACETGENKELDYQIKVAKVKLAGFSIDISELEFWTVNKKGKAERKSCWI